MTPEGEEWRPVVGYEGIYEVSTEGRVKSLARTIVRSDGVTINKRERILRPGRSGKYRTVSLFRDGVQRTEFLHRLVLRAFIGLRPPGMEGCHNDGDGMNNRLSNLRWDTAHSNMLDTIKHGRHVHARKTHCKRGHEFTPENTKRAGKDGKGRRCRACRDDWDRQYRMHARQRQEGAA